MRGSNYFISTTKLARAIKHFHEEPFSSPVCLPWFSQNCFQQFEYLSGILVVIILVFIYVQIICRGKQFPHFKWRAGG